ncbi:MAG: hypothetical protein Q4F67_02230 [Propionibacteriaceae bacterium]|nr:hypothetical protein [Propionibacteriaceae bacterium]
MALYARPSERRVRQIIGDVFVVGWIVGWGVGAYQVWASIMAVAEPARRTASAAAGVRDHLGDAAQAAGGVPVAGGELRRPLDSAGISLDDLVTAAQDQVRTLEQLAWLSGSLLFVLPVALVLALWLPGRLRFVRQSTAVEKLIDADSDLELFALRAIATQPVRELARVSPDPVGDWRDGRWPVIVALADLELRSIGLRVPAELERANAARPAVNSDGKV